MSEMVTSLPQSQQISGDNGCFQELVYLLSIYSVHSLDMYRLYRWRATLKSSKGPTCRTPSHGPKIEGT